MATPRSQQPSGIWDGEATSLLEGEDGTQDSPAGSSSPSRGNTPILVRLGQRDEGLGQRDWVYWDGGTRDRGTGFTGMEGQRDWVYWDRGGLRQYDSPILHRKKKIFNFLEDGWRRWSLMGGRRQRQRLRQQHLNKKLQEPRIQAERRNKDSVLSLSPQPSLVPSITSPTQPPTPPLPQDRRSASSYFHLGLGRLKRRKSD